ncbi:hypothetical protein [Ectobacillus sp. sgz5001026]|uniref:hypothetical protein n=1 Tax=Ectobacillus sp. sgz5001026 TaxID=3242473 RepID=UPI0036D3DD18
MELKLTDKRLLIISLLLLNIGMLFGQKIEGRLAYSNVFQILSILVLIPITIKVFQKRDYVFVTLNICMMAIGALWISNVYETEIQMAHIIFFLVMIIYISTLFSLINKYKIQQAILAVYKYITIPICLYFCLFAVEELFIQKSGYISLGFDDKSHAAILCAFFAFMSLVLFTSSIRFVLSLMFMVLSLLTISRFSLIFLALYIPVFLYNFVTSSKKLLEENRKSKYVTLYIQFLLFLGTTVFASLFVIQNQSMFGVFTRAEAGGDNGSTTGHMLLIQYGLQIKFQNLMNLIFGITPGEYSLVATHAGIDLSKFAMLDPTGYQAMLLGLMPMHSSHLSFFVEFPLLFFITYLFLLVTIFVGLVKKKRIIELFFFVGFVIATSFYSSHNELFFYSIFVYLLTISALPSKANAILNFESKKGVA